MDIVKINELTQNKKIAAARDFMYSPQNLTKDHSLTLMLYACKKMYGLRNTVKIVHGMGVKNL